MKAKTKKPRVVWVVWEKHLDYPTAAVFSLKRHADERRDVWNVQDEKKSYTVKKFVEAKRGE